MSLTSEQKTNTIREFQDNMNLLGLDTQTIADHFGVSRNTIERIITLRSGILEYPWIVRGYLLDTAKAQGTEPIPFTALRGDPHDYWFLDDRIIDANTIA